MAFAVSSAWSGSIISGSVEISKALHCKVLDYTSFMRKIVVDGSNTSGFQRTGIVGMDRTIYCHPAENVFLDLSSFLSLHRIFEFSPEVLLHQFNKIIRIIGRRGFL